MGDFVLKERRTACDVCRDGANALDCASDETAVSETREVESLMIGCGDCNLRSAELRA